MLCGQRGLASPVAGPWSLACVLTPSAYDGSCLLTLHRSLQTRSPLGCYKASNSLAFSLQLYHSVCALDKRNRLVGCRRLDRTRWLHSWDKTVISCLDSSLLLGGRNSRLLENSSGTEAGKGSSRRGPYATSCPAPGGRKWEPFPPQIPHIL